MCHRSAWMSIRSNRTGSLDKTSGHGRFPRNIRQSTAEKYGPLDHFTKGFDMTRPKRHLPGERVLITRRTLERRSFLGCSEDTREIVEYALALYAPKYGIDVHALMVMSNHIHLVITDTEGNRSDFMRAFFGLIARTRNNQLGRSDSFWTGAPPGDCVLLADETVWKKCLYTWMNPQKAGLSQWKGLSIGIEQWSKKRIVYRPSSFFTRSALPKTVSYTPVPPAMDGFTLPEVRKLYASLMDASVSNATEHSPRICPPERLQWRPSRSKETRKLNPAYAGPKPLREAYAHELGEFRSLYVEAMKKTREGRFDEARFPPGTIHLRRLMPHLCQDEVKSHRLASCPRT